MTFAAMAFMGAGVVFGLGVIWTSGVYGSRRAWLLGVVLPLLLLTAVFAGLAGPHASRRGATPDYPPSPPWRGENNRLRLPGVPKTGGARKLFIMSATLLALPFALAAVYLLVYALLFVRHFLLH